jgi:class 3 adenylate cyclase/tetratricopeptide (TPR) repeat protein
MQTGSTEEGAGAARVAKQMAADELRQIASTVMFADVVEYVRLAELDELGTIRRVKAFIEHLSGTVIPGGRGTVLEVRGDGVLMNFEGPLDAVRCAFAIHQAALIEGALVPQAPPLQMRVGIHAADVWTDGRTVYGTAVNLAARIASLAGPAETVITDSVRDRILVGLDADIHDLGNCFLKHVATAVRAYRLTEAQPNRLFGLVSRPAAVERLGRARVGVLPFLPDAGDGDPFAVGDLIAQNLIHSVSRIATLDVVAWLTSKGFRGRSLSVPDIGAALGADWLVCGTFRMDGEQLLVQAELIRVASGLAELFERATDRVDDLLQPQSAIAARFAASFSRHIAGIEARRVALHHLPTLHSHSLLIGAIGLMHRSVPGQFVRSRDALEHLIDRHPRMHAVRPWLAKWYVMRNTRGLSDDPQGDAQRAIDHTSRALDASPDDTFSMAVQGFVEFHIRRNVDTAAQLLGDACRSNPNDALAATFNAAVLAATGDTMAARDQADRAIALSPYDPLRAYMLMISATCALYADDFARGTLLAQASIRESATHAAVWRTLVIGLVGCGRLEEARTACAHLLTLEPGLTLRGYQARLAVPERMARIAIEALRTAGVPES